MKEEERQPVHPTESDPYGVREVWLAQIELREALKQSERRTKRMIALGHFLMAAGVMLLLVSFSMFISVFVNVFS